LTVESGGRPVSAHFSSNTKRSAMRKQLVGTVVAVALLFILSDAVAVAATGNLNVTVKDHKGDVKENAVVVRYLGGSPVSGTTDSGGLVSWIGIDVGTYSLEVYFNGGLWVRGSATVVADSTTNVTLQEIEPYVVTPYTVGFQVLDATTNNPIIAPVPVGTALKFQVQVRNSTTASRAVRVVLTLDRDMSGPFDSSQTSGTQTIAGGATKTYTFTYTPQIGRTWLWRVQVQTIINGKFVNTEVTDWDIAFSVAPAPGNLNVIVQDENGDPPTDGAVVFLYRYDIASDPPHNLTLTLAGTKSADSSGLASWTGIEGQGYVVEAYYNDAFGASGSIDVFPAGTAIITLRRNEPIPLGLQIFDVSGATPQDVTNGTVAANTPLRFDITVKNINTAPQDVKVTLLFDRDKTLPWDLPESSNTTDKKTIAAGVEATFSLDFTPVLGGEYYARVEVKTSYNGAGYVVTGILNWGDAPILTVTPELPGSLNVTVQDEDGHTRADAVVLRYRSGAPPALIDSKPTNASGVASWTNIPAQGYVLEVYYNGGFWASGATDVLPNGTASITLRRVEPLAVDDFELVYANNPAQHVTGPVAAGTPLRAIVQVKNILTIDPQHPEDTKDRVVKVRLVFDLTKSEPYNIDVYSAPQTISGGDTATFTIDFTPLVSGAYFRRVEVDSKDPAISGSDFVPTDISAWISTFTVTLGIGNLNVTVKNQNGGTVSGAVVVRYTSGGSLIDKKTTNSSGSVSWTGIASDDYWLEAYGNMAFWAGATVSVQVGVTTNVILQRNEPYVTSFKVFNANTNADVTNSFIQSGTPLRVEVGVRNGSAEDRTVRINVFVDRSKSSSYDFSRTSAERIISSGDTHTFIFNFTPTSAGKYFRRVTVEEKSFNDTFAFTDLPAVWDSAFTVVTAPPLEITGHVLTSGSAPMPNVLVRAIYKDGVTITGEAVTDAGGSYALGVPSGWLGRVIVADFPDFPAYTFYPSLRNFSKIATSQSGQDFTGWAPITISGHVRLANSTPVSGVVVTANNGGGTSTTFTDGSYSLTVPGGPSGWTGTVVPSAIGYAFAPVYRYYTGITSAQIGQDFTAYAGDTVDYLVVTGPGTVKEKMSANYTCTAHYTSGRDAEVTRLAKWSVDSSATIDSAGKLTAKDVGSDKVVKITATYGGKKSAPLSVTILQVVSLTISGPLQVNESSSADYTCTATYSDSSTMDVTNLAQWSEDSSYTTINSSGHLTTSAVSSDKTAKIKAKFGGKDKTLIITIKNT